MHFKGITCLTKVSENQTQTERTDTSIHFNKSIIEIEDDISLNFKIDDREVFYLASCDIIKEKDYRGCRPLIKVSINWVNRIEESVKKLEIPKDTTDILIITFDIYKSLKEKGYSDEDIYTEFKTKGLGKMSVELPEVEDFSALISQIIME